MCKLIDQIINTQSTQKYIRNTVCNSVHACSPPNSWNYTSSCGHLLIVLDEIITAKWAILELGVLKVWHFDPKMSLFKAIMSIYEIFKSKKVVNPILLASYARWVKYLYDFLVLKFLVQWDHTHLYGWNKAKNEVTMW